MYRTIGQLYSILNKSQKKRILKLQFLVITMAILELVAISSIAPFMALVGDISIIENEGALSQLYAMSSVESPISFVFILGVLLLVILGISTFFSVITVWRLSTFAYDTGTEIADQLFTYYIDRDWLFHVENNSSYLIKQIAGDSQRVTNNVLQPLLQLNAKVVLVIVLCSALVIYRWEVAVGGLLIFTFAYLVLFKLVRKRLDRNGKFISKLTEYRFKIMSEVFGGVKELILTNRKDDAKSKFNRSGSELAECQGVNTAIGSTPRYIMEFIAFGSIIILLLYLYVKFEGNISEILPVISLCALAGFKLLPAFQAIYTSIAQIKGNVAAFEAIKVDMIKSKESMNTFNLETSENLSVVYFDNISDETEILLDKVKFSYPNSHDLSLDIEHLAIKKSTTVGLVGSSGAGKSTLVDLILGLLEPSSGNVRFSISNRKEKCVKSWQQQIGYVPQTIYLSEGSILENVAFGLDREDIDIEKVKIALDKSELLNYVLELPDGLETNVGEKGIKLSGGQRQRVGIARALYHDPDVLVFDEATSALDGITEKAIMYAVDKMGHDKTIIIIAHRLNTIRNPLSYF